VLLRAYAASRHRFRPSVDPRLPADASERRETEYRTAGAAMSAVDRRRSEVQGRDSEEFLPFL